jgi:dephospho-CoA kinase
LVVVAVAGRIGAGKSAIAEATARALGCRRSSFGQAVRAYAEQRDLSLDRTALQNLGEEMIADEGWTAFVARVLSRGAGSVVVDGVRHFAAVDALRSASAGRDGFLLVFVDASFERRAERVMARDDVTSSELEAADRHRNEADVDAIRGIADVVIDNEREDVSSLADAVETIVAAASGSAPGSRPA